MIKFFLFVKKIHFLLLFIIMESLAIRYYAGSTSFTQAKIITTSNFIIGQIHNEISSVANYFNLKQENEKLNLQLAELSNRIDQLAIINEDTTLSVILNGREYESFAAKVVNNSITKLKNYITINKGSSDGFMPDMALVSDGGVVGYVLNCSEKFSVAISILNKEFKTAGKIKNGDYFGSVFWDGKSFEHVTLSEIPKYATIKPGDTIVTDYSSRFPSGIMIGTVVDFELRNATYYDVRVKLHSNMATINNIMAVKYLDKGEIEALEEKSKNPNIY